MLIATGFMGIGYGLYLWQLAPYGAIGLAVAWGGGALLTYIVVAEDLIDLGTGMRRIIRSLVVAIITLSIYIAGIYLVQIFLGDFLRSTFLSRFFDSTLLVAAVTAVLLTIVYTPIRRMSQSLTNRVLFGQHYDFQVVIHNYGQAISHLLNLDELAGMALAQISRALRLTDAVLFILESESTQQFFLRTLPAANINGFRPVSLCARIPPSPAGW